jgi:hypothetical protein
MCLSGVLAVASIVLHHQSSTSTSTSQGDINAQARTLIVQSRTLPASDIRILRDAALQAMSNRYFSGGITRATMNGAPKSFDHPHDKEEFELDNRGLLRFRRITHPERGVFQPERVVLHEYTGLPAVRCSDRSVRPGKKLSISYSQDRGKWYVTPSITLGEEGLPEFEHPLQLSLQAGRRVE